MDRALRIQLRAGFVPVPAPSRDEQQAVRRDVLATLMSNIAAFGYALSREAFAALRHASDGSARAWWEAIEPVLMDLTGADRKMDEHVVYKNFPHEVLAMSEADYWLRQILMYWGLPNEWFTETELPRPPKNEKLPLRVLQPAAPDVLRAIYRERLMQPTRWTKEQREDAGFLAERLRDPCDLSIVAFKENMVQLALACLARGVPARVGTATDVLRLAAGMSEGDVSLRERTKLRRFSRAERRFLLDLLERSGNLADDFARRPERYKRLVHALHAGDYCARYPSVVAAADALYRDALPQTIDSLVEERIRTRDRRLLQELAARPGEMMRKLHRLLLVYGDAAVEAFIGVMPRLTLMQLLKIERYLAKVNERTYRLFPPQGDWSRLQYVLAPKSRRLPAQLLKPLLAALASAIRARVERRVASVQLDRNTQLVTLPTSDNELLPYGRGTVFTMPDDVRFLRTAVYWSAPSRGNVWYDNGWNFFGADWSPCGACCWNAVRYRDGAVFSGDPTNSKDLDGRACQMIDLYLDRLAGAGVRYAVWSILCYSQVSFDEAKEVFAALQWGKDPEAGKLFDPARCQLSFPIKGPQYTKYVAFVDVAKRRVVYVDANLRASVSSAAGNGKLLGRVFPAFVEYLDGLPTVHDVFAHVTKDETGMPVRYSDRGAAIVDREAWVFQPENEASRFTPFALNDLLTR